MSEARFLALGLTDAETRSQVSDERSRAVLRAIEAGATLTQIARKLGVTVGRVAQIRDATMRKLKRGHRSPLEKLSREAILTEDMRSRFRWERNRLQQELALYRRLHAKYGTPSSAGTNPTRN